MDTLITPRLRLRAARAEDLDDLHAVFGDPVAMRFWSTLPHAERDQTRDWLDAMIAASPETSADFVIEHEGRAIGKAGCYAVPEIGYILHRDFWGQGLAREALTAVLPYLFSRFPVDARRRRRRPAQRGLARPADDAGIPGGRPRRPDLPDRRGVVRQRLPGAQPPLIAVSTITADPGASGVSKVARSPSTKMLMWRRIAGRESQIRSRIPGQAWFSASIAASTVAAVTGTRRGEPGNSRCKAPGRITVTDGAPVIVGYPSSTSVSTDRIAGRCSAMQVQRSPSSRLANSAPEPVPKYTPAGSWLSVAMAWRSTPK